MIRGTPSRFPPSQSSQRAAATAYAGLKVYHAPLTAAFVGRAISLTPERQRIYENMRFASEADARKQLAQLLAHMLPLVEEIRASLDRMGANFPDRVG